ncbi:MAG: Gx transporter family protein [Clostridia bacterium]|nr:Gx transporter family protein [Clostridia bacterium]
MNKTKRYVYCAMLTAVAMMFSWLEHLIPFDFGIPGVKLGLANIATVVTLYLFGCKMAVGVSVVRIVLSSLLFGGVVPMIYSLAGGLCSLCGMILLYRWGRLGHVGVSAVGGVLHNFGQLLAAFVVVPSLGLWSYTPVLVISGTLTGVVVGVVASVCINRLGSVIKC